MVTALDPRFLNVPISLFNKNRWRSVSPGVHKQDEPLPKTNQRKRSNRHELGRSTSTRKSALHRNFKIGVGLLARYKVSWFTSATIVGAPHGHFLECAPAHEQSDLSSCTLCKSIQTTELSKVIGFYDLTTGYKVVFCPFSRVSCPSLIFTKRCQS